MAEILLEEHPLALEIQSLRATVARFQDEAHASAVKLQRHSLDAVRAHERAVHLERENDVLKSELAVLRGHVLPSSGPASTSSSSGGQNQIEELTLSLRRLSHKLSLTEEALLVANTSLATSQAQSLKATASADNAYELGARVRGREEEALGKQRDLEWRIKKLEEELRMSDGVVREYASLVRGMETRSSSDVEPQLEDSLKEGKMGLERLFTELQGECDASERRFHAKQAELEVCQSHLEAERRTREVLEKDLAGTRTELEKLKLEDGTAAKMVSRYMQFSQSVTNKLLTTLNNLRARHNGTLATLSSQNHVLSTQLRSLENQNEQLRSTLDELGGEIMKEAFGRRREIAQRIRMGGREERIVEGLRRWIRRGDEMLSRLHGDEEYQESQSHIYDPLLDMSQHARILLEGLENGVLDEASAFSLSGARARETLVRLGIDGLLEELGKETERRITLEKSFVTTGSQEIKMDQQDDDAPPKVPEKIARTFDKELPSSKLPIAFDEKTDPITISSTVVEDPMADVKGIQSPTTQPVSPLDVEPQDEATLPTPPIDPPQPLEEALPEKMEVVKELETKTLLEHTFEDTEKALSSTTEPSAVVPISVDVPTVEIASEDPPIADDEEIEMAIANPTVSSKIEVDDPSPPVPPEAHDVLPAPPVPEVAIPPSIPDIPSTVECIPPQPHPMLAELVRINKRYDDLQRAFRDCHLALESLKAGLGSDTSSISSTSSPFGQSLSSSSTSSLISPSPVSHIIPTSILRAALGRLDDFTEDARVELEIRVGDEELLAKGYEALLSVPGALDTTNRSTALDGDEGDGEREIGDIPVQSEVEKQIEAFVSGSDPAVRKARDGFSKKLEDVQHDIAALKRAIHDPEFLEVPDFSLDASASASTSSLALPTHPEPTNGNGNGWSSWIRPSSRPSTPAPVSASLGPSPTFGSIMTSPRLRHSPSNGSFQSQSQGSTRSRKGSFFGFGLGGAPEQNKDPLSLLGLRVPMPHFGSPASNGTGNAQLFGGGYGLMSPTSPMGMGSAPRPRTVSTTMYSLGIGAHHHSGTSSPSSNPMQMARSVSAGFVGHNQTHLNGSSSSHRDRQQPNAQKVARNGNDKEVVDEEGGDTTDEDETEDEANTDVE